MCKNTIIVLIYHCHERLDLVTFFFFCVRSLKCLTAIFYDSYKLINLTNWFLMMPSIATKFQYVNSFLFSFLLTTCFGPYGSSSGEIYKKKLINLTPT
jgi:hypothetical protein